MQRYSIEFIGTFFLVLVVALTGNPLAIGAILVAMVYMGGSISGAHYNPAVTLAVWLRGKIKGAEALRYMLVQLAGGVAAAATYYAINGTHFAAAPGRGVSWLAAFLVELLFTFALASTVLRTAVDPATTKNQYYGLAIGFVLMAAAFAGGAISGGAFNPAVGAGPLLFDLMHLHQHLSQLWLYLAGPLAGGALASLLYQPTKAS